MKSGLFRGFASAVIGTVLASGTVSAQTEQDGGLWIMWLGQGSLDGISPELEDFRWWLDIQPRFVDRVDQFLVRPALGYAFADEFAAWLGYTWVHSSLSRGGHVDEQQVWEQVTWNPGTEPVVLGVRTRLEQRFLDPGDDVGWRLRQFVKAVYPLPSEPRLRLTAYDEVFFHLNDTDWGARAGFAENRVFAGLGWQWQSGMTAELGYLNQFFNLQNRDLMNHLVSVNFIFSF